MKKLEGGLRLNGISKKKTLITIITVVRNGEKTLEKTIKSVINQTARKDIEYIIIDGVSTDKTLDIIKKYNNKIDYWISESDKGIYDAMNKGVLLSRGGWIYFLGCDDYLSDDKVLSKIVPKISLDFDFIYGNVVVKHPIYKRLLLPNREINLKLLKLRNFPCHQGIFMKKDLIIGEGSFNLKYKLSADYDLICKCFIKRYNIFFIPLTIAVFNEFGASSNINIRDKETFDIIKKHFGISSLIKYKIYIYFRRCIEKIFRLFNILSFYQKIKIKKIKRINNKVINLF